MIRSGQTSLQKGGSAGLHWYCLKTKAKRESFAAKQLLQRTQLEVFAPRVCFEPVNARRSAVSEPLFPGYIFCRLEIGEDLRFAESTPDVLGVVKFGRYAPPVSDSVVDFLRSQTASPFKLEPVFETGEWVTILEGVFCGEKARVLSFDRGQDRACLLLTLLGAEVPLHLPTRSLRGVAEKNHFPAPLLAHSNG